MEPQIRYARTTDGVSIAFSVMGSGVALVHPLVPISHLLLTSGSPIWRPWLDTLAGRYQLVLYDGRGNGLSQRGLESYPPGHTMLDLEGVVDELALDHFVVFAPYQHGYGALRLAIMQPDRVKGVILWVTPLNSAGIEQTRARTLAEQDWDFFLQNVAQSFNWLEPRDVRAYVEVLKQCQSQQDYLRQFTDDYDVEALLPAVRTPVLVLHPRELDLVKAEEAMRLASLIPGARLVLLDGPVAIPTGDVVQPALRAVDEFVADLTGDHLGRRGVTAEHTFRTVLFTDIVGHTEMMQRLGDAKGRDVLREHERITRETLKQHGGAEVKTMGDGFMASFGSVTSALDCAIALQRAFTARTDAGAQPAAPAVEPISIRVGLNAGEPIEEDGDLFGSTVILAARIAAKAHGGEILIPEPVRHLLSGKAFTFSDRGEFAMKGFDDAVRVYEVRWRE